MTDAKIVCDGCGRKYRWKPELAGKKVKCKCGHAMKAPEQPPEEDAIDDLYALADEEKRAAVDLASASSYRCPSCQSAMEPGAAMCVRCGFNIHTGAKATARPVAVGAAAGGGGAAGPTPVLGYGGPLPRQFGGKEELENTIGGSAMRELYVPAALVLAGLAMQYFHHMYDGGSWRSFSAALPFVGASMAFNLVLSFLGVIVVARLLEMSFGAPGPAVLKLAAACLLPPAIAAFVGALVGADSYFVRVMVSALLLFPLAFFTFQLLFDFDFDEAIYCVVIIWLVNEWVVTFIVAALLGGGALFLAGSDMPTAADFDEDARATQMLRSRNAFEASAWVEEKGNHLLREHTHEESVQLVNHLYDLGADTVTAYRPDLMADKLIITLPKDREARKRLFDFEAQWARRGRAQPAVDEGQRYLTIDMWLAPRRNVDDW